MTPSQNSASTAPDISAETHYIIGRDAAGQWLALEIHRRSGGLFKSCQSAIRYVEFETGHRIGAYELSPTPLALTF